MLPPGNIWLFPKPLKMPTKQGHYFAQQPIGHNRLGNMMSPLSEEAKLSKKYTNHSLRAISVHVLDSAQVPTRHIMSITGHKSENSFKTYTGQPDSKAKKFMSHTISKSLGLPVEEKKENTIPKIVYDPVNEAQMIKSHNAQVPKRRNMSVAGHKSESSLKTYNGQPDSKAKKFRSHTIRKAWDFRLKKQMKIRFRKPCMIL